MAIDEKTGLAIPCRFCGNRHRECDKEFCYCNSGYPTEATMRGEGFNLNCEAYWSNF